MSNMMQSSGFGPKDTVKKGHEVVMARGQSELDLVDSKLFTFLLQKAYRQLNTKRIHTLPVKEALEYLGHNSVKNLEKSLKKLCAINIEIDYKDDRSGKEHSVSCHFLSYEAHEMSNASSGVINYAFDPICLQYLWEPKVYARINMRFLRQFKTLYGAKLYEIMSFYQHRFYRTWHVTIDDLREKLCVEEGAYQRYDNLRRAVIDKAVAEVNKLAPFSIEVEAIRGGRGGRVVALNFNIVAKSEVEVEADNAQLTSPSTRDPNTNDFFDGKTDDERGLSLDLQVETIDKARELMSEFGMDVDSLQSYIDNWKDTVSGKRVNDPDIYFLRWLRLECEKFDDANFDILDPSVMASVLRKFD